MIRRSTSQSLRPLEGRELKEAKKFKYLGSAVLVEEEVKNDERFRLSVE